MKNKHGIETNEKELNEVKELTQKAIDYMNSPTKKELMKEIKQIMKDIDESKISKENSYKAHIFYANTKRMLEIKSEDQLIKMASKESLYELRDILKMTKELQKL